MPYPRSNQSRLCRYVLFIPVVQLVSSAHFLTKYCNWLFAITFMMMSAVQGQQPKQQEYFKKIQLFVEGNTNSLISDAQPGTPLYQKIFGPCLTGQQKGELSMQKMFYTELRNRVEQAITNMYKQQRLVNYFQRRPQEKVKADAYEEIKKQSAETNDRLRLICKYPPEQQNQPPNANAGEDQTITLPTNFVLLKGTGTDPDGDPPIFYWQKFTGADNAVIISPNNSITRIENLEVGEYEFLLTVTDNRNGYGYDTVKVTVKPPIENKLPPKAEAGIDQRKNENETITLSGRGKDDDGRIVSYQWRMIPGDASGQITDPSSATTEVTGMEPGEYIFELTVTDNDGLSDRDSLKVIIDALPPPVPSPGIPAWVWIIIGMVILGGTTTGYYFFWWGRRRKKLIVYFMNPEEEALAHELMPGHKKTDGYILGHSTQAKIKKMKKKGLALRVLNTTVLTVHTPGATRTYKYSIKKGAHELVSVTHESPGYNYVNIITDENVVAINNNMAVPAGAAASPQDHELPAFYIITLDAPLLPVFNEQLEAIGLSILQRVPFDSYIIKINDRQQLEMIQHHENFRFIRMIKQYTAEDTGFTVRKDHFDNAGTPAVDTMLTMDLVLHREDDAPLVRDFLGSHGIERIALYRNTIRVRVPAGNDIAYKLSSNKYIQAIYEHIPPVMHNDIARQIISMDMADQQVPIIEEDGAGEIIAVADTGIDKKHPDFSSTAIEAVAWGRKTTGDTSDPHG
ncbi:MAG: PKD domain-containing protein, partial [Chitinophagaceae bacterium]|nr:PKD domain-containing protein [Chitinophagaceae bacterium]